MKIDFKVGGDDQWFHFTGGAELICKETGKDAYAFTIPLLATSDGKKMGKTEKVPFGLKHLDCRSTITISIGST